jgi:hypothetical protein
VILCNQHSYQHITAFATATLKPRLLQPATRVAHRDRPTIYIDTSAILEALHLHFFLPLEVVTLIETSELEIVKDNTAVRQVEEICEGKLLQE